MSKPVAPEKPALQPSRDTAVHLVKVHGDKSPNGLIILLQKRTEVQCAFNVVKRALKFRGHFHAVLENGVHVIGCLLHAVARDAQAAIVSDFAAGILVLVALDIKIFGFLAVFHDDEADTVALVVFKVSDDIIVGKLELDNLKIFVGGRRLISLRSFLRDTLRDLLFAAWFVVAA